MPTVRLEVSRWLRQSLNLEPSGSGEVLICALEGESILGLIRRLATEQGGFWQAIFDRESQTIAANVLTVLNGCITNPGDPSEALLKEGDRLTFLPMFDGG
jgi:molybdopterin converting factor small subunit